MTAISAEGVIFFERDITKPPYLAVIDATKHKVERYSVKIGEFYAVDRSGHTLSVLVVVNRAFANTSDVRNICHGEFCKVSAPRHTRTDFFRIYS